MLERLLELLLHAKSGVFAGILLVGTTGALVTATVATAGNVTTITLTQASASPSASASATASPTASPTHSPSASPTTSPSSSLNTSTTSTTTCTADPGTVAAVKTVDTAFTMYHTDLVHLRTDNKGDAGKSIIEKADKQLKQIRHDAVKAIHAAASCKTDTKDDEDKTEQDDEDKTEKDIEDQDDDNDPTSTARSTGTDSNLLVVFFNNLFGKHGTTTPTTTTTTTVTGDAQTLADNAVAAMKLVFDTAKSDLDKAATTNATPKPAHSPEHSNTTKGDKGKGKSGDHSGGDD